jgi:hypothetical protein
MNKLKLVALTAALLLREAPAFADQTPAPAQVVALAQVQAPAVEPAATNGAQDLEKTHPRVASNYVFRGSAFAAAGRVGTKQ